MTDTPMATNIRRVALVLFLAFGALGLSLVYWQVVRAGELTGNPRYNATRLQAEADRIVRGTIVDRNGTVLAQSVETPQGRVRRYSSVATAHAVGYASPRWGAAGVEAAFAAYLRGDRSDAVAALLGRWTRGEQRGADLVLTLDAHLQAVADAALGDNRGAVVGLDPRTGEVLVMVSHPLFDPNTVEERLGDLAGRASAPLVNRATQGLYPPGSTFKLVTLAAALDAGTVRPDTSFSLEATRQVELNNYTLRWENPVGRALSLQESLVYSCNTCFAEMGIALGADRLRATAERFGFEQRLPIEIDAAVSRLGRPAYLNDRGGLGFTAFGQGELEATPLEMALVAATIANGGTAPTPHLARELRAPDGRVLDRFNPGPWHSVVRPETARFVGQAMGALVEAGQAPAAGLPGVAVAGKTGTAEVGPGVEPHAWFVAYAPADNPQIALAVIIENGGFGSRAAVPVAAQVLRAALNR